MLIVLILFLIPAVTLEAAVVTQKQPELCAYMGGTFTPKGPDVCPDGSWLVVYEFWKDHTATPKK